MFILISDRGQNISSQIEGSFNYRGISIYSKKEKYYITLGEGYYFDNGKKTAKLLPGRYIINIDRAFYQLKLYVYENCDGITDYHFYKTCNFIMACSKKADIISYDPFLKDAYLICKDGEVSSNYELSVNERRCSKAQLDFGDKVEFLGFCFIYYDDFLYMNSFQVTNRLEEYPLKRLQIAYPQRYDRIPVCLDEHYEDLAFDKIRKYETNNIHTQSDILRNIIPNIVMSMAMGLVSAAALLNNPYQNTLSIITYTVSPVAIFITGVILPLIFHFSQKRKMDKEEKRKLDVYLEYLAGYEKNADQQITGFISHNQKRYFDLEALKHEPFSLGRKSDDFLSISLGKCMIARDLEYERSGVELIDESIERLARKASAIQGYPLLYKISKHKITTIVSKAEQKAYFFHKFLLELSFRHYYGDIALAVYAQDSALIDSFYNLPHLFHNGKRLYFNSFRGLQELDQLKINKPLILLIYDRCDYSFSNPNLHLLYFSTSRNDLYTGSECLIEYLSNSAYLLNEKRTDFTYVEEDIDFAFHFDRLGRFNNLFHEQHDISFMKLFAGFDIKQNYQNRQNGLRADFAYTDNEVMSFDLHEDKQGPHGLIGGATGSGKSELIVSLLLSMCIRYSPLYLNIILIDYKGGGIKESLSVDGISLPHIIGSINNLQNNNLERFLIALNNECIRRQKLFKEASAHFNRSIMNIDDYRECDQQMAHLLIVVDEFAELKKENPEQIKQLISIARIGRSLGLHLILATQKPAGNIDEEIWSNSRFKLSLKVYEEKDSQDLIRSKDAAYLSQPGEFLLRVDESIVSGRSIYAKKDTADNEPYQVSVLDNRLDIVKTYQLPRQSGISEAAYFVSRIISICQEMRLQAATLNFLAPSSAKRKEIAEQPGFVVGISDDYYRSISRPLIYPLDSNILIVSSRPKEIASYLNTLNENKRPSIVISDKRYQGSFIRDSLLYEENEDICFLMEKLLEKDEDLTVLIEDLNVMFSFDDIYQELLLKLLKRANTRHCRFILFSSVSQIAYRLLSSVERKLLIESDDPGDVAYLFGRRSRYKGSSFFYEDEVVSFVPALCEEYKTSERKVKPFISHIPSVINSKIFEGMCLLGYDLKEREAVYFDEELLITSFDEERLELYRHAYGDRFEIISYDHHLSESRKKNILWLGSGIFSQRLFITSLKDDLKENEGILCRGGSKRLIRSIDETPDIIQIQDRQE